VETKSFRDTRPEKKSEGYGFDFLKKKNSRSSHREGERRRKANYGKNERKGP